jgi:hypothetical protein
MNPFGQVCRKFDAEYKKRPGSMRRSPFFNSTYTLFHPFLCRACPPFPILPLAGSALISGKFPGHSLLPKMSASGLIPRLHQVPPEVSWAQGFAKNHPAISNN